MAGSGSRDWNPTPPNNPCRTLSFRAVLNSPQANVIRTLQIGNELLLIVQPSPPHAVVATHNGSEAGTITGSQMASLVNCIRNGFKFVATVVELRSGQCIVDVHIQ